MNARSLDTTELVDPVTLKAPLLLPLPSSGMGNVVLRSVLVREWVPGRHRQHAALPVLKVLSKAQCMRCSETGCETTARGLAAAGEVRAQYRVTLTTGYRWFG